MSPPADPSTQAFYLCADGIIRSCSTSSCAEAQTLDVVSISSKFSLAVKDLAVVCGVSLLPSASHEAPVEEFKKWAEGIASIQCAVPPCLPMPPTFALPPIHWIPHPSFYDPNQKVPLLVALEEQVLTPTTLEEPVHAEVVGNYQTRCTSAEDPSSRTWLIQPTTQASTSDENQKLNKPSFGEKPGLRAWLTHSTTEPNNSDADEKTISQYETHRNDPHDYAPATDDPPLKCARVGEADSFAWRHALTPQICYRAADPTPISTSPKPLPGALEAQVSTSASLEEPVQAEVIGSCHARPTTAELTQPRSGASNSDWNEKNRFAVRKR